MLQWPVAFEAVHVVIKYRTSKHTTATDAAGLWSSSVGTALHTTAVSCNRAMFCSFQVQRQPVFCMAADMPFIVMIMVSSTADLYGCL